MHAGRAHSLTIPHTEHIAPPRTRRLGRTPAALLVALGAFTVACGGGVGAPGTVSSGRDGMTAGGLSADSGAWLSTAAKRPWTNAASSFAAASAALGSLVSKR